MITKISIKGLYGYLNAEYNFSEPVSIITGPNGCGKTTLLKMVQAVLNPDPDLLDWFWSVKFDEFKIEFDDGKHLTFDSNGVVDTNAIQSINTDVINVDNEYPYDFVARLDQECFVEMINKSLYNKHIEVDNQRNIHIKHDDQELPLVLSDGEKRLFTIYQQAIFRANRKTVLIIDEPERSIHIETQEQLVYNMLKIAKINGCQIIMATHSPNIINGHVELIAQRK